MGTPRAQSASSRARHALGALAVALALLAAAGCQAGPWGWGRNARGQIGDGSLTGRATPAVLDPSWRVVDAGWTHSFAIRDDGTLWAWGLNGYGQLGDGTSVGRSKPVQIGSAIDWVICRTRWFSVPEPGSGIGTRSSSPQQ